MDCNYCNGDEAVFWQDDDNNAFVDSKGEMLVTVNGYEVKFNVECCPMCGRRFGLNEEAEWIEEGGLLPRCSACGEYSDDALNRGGNYCHNCGKKMKNAQ